MVRPAGIGLRSEPRCAGERSLTVAACSFLWQRVCHDSCWSVECREVGVGATTAAGSRCRDEEVLPPAKFVHGGCPTGDSTQLKLRQLLAASAVVHVNLAVSGRNEQHSCGGGDDSSFNCRRRTRPCHSLTDET